MPRRSGAWRAKKPQSEQRRLPSVRLRPQDARPSVRPQRRLGLSPIPSVIPRYRPTEMRKLVVQIRSTETRPLAIHAAHADRDALPRDSRGADTPDLQEEQQEPSRPSAVMDRAEREKMRAKYAQYAHYSPTQYASHNEDGTISSESDRSPSGSDKPSVKQSRWGGRG